MKIALLFLSLLLCVQSYGQTVTLSIDFESGSVVNGDFLNFDGGIATVIANPQSSALNSSATVGQMVRNGGQVWAGAYLTTPANVNFSTDPYICMKVWTTAPIGTRVALKMEGCGGSCFREIDAFTTVTGEWETLCYDYTGEATIYNRLVFLFDLGNLGNGTANSTFYFDDVEKVTEPPLALTPGSQYFCPDEVLTLTFPGAGTYNWYDEATGGNLILANNATYVTSLLTADSSWFVQDMTPTTIGVTDVGPTSKGASDPQSGTASVFFTSNLDNGFWYGVDIVEKIVGGGPPPYSCTYTVTGFNHTQSSIFRTQVITDGLSADNKQVAFTWATALPMDLNDNMELRVSVVGDVGCFISSHHAGGDVITSYPASSSGSEVVFTSHTPSATQWMGFDYSMSGDLIDQTRARLNAIADCAIVLPIELLDFYVATKDGNAHIHWSTASETNNQIFLVERTTNGTDFETVGTLPGAGTSTMVNHYSFVDEAPKSGVSYYRIKQVDFDGAQSVSHLLPFSNEETQVFGVYPNPTAGHFILSHSGEALQSISVEIRDVTGRVIELCTGVDTDAALGASFDIEKYPAGIYTVIVQGVSERWVVRVVKR